MANADDLHRLNTIDRESYNQWRGNHSRSVDLAEQHFSGRDLSGYDLSNTNLNKCDLSGAILRGAKLVHTTLNGANLAGADFTDADCERATFLHSQMGGTILCCTNLDRAKFFPKQEPEGVLESCMLSAADLAGAHLEGWHFRGRCVLDRANLSGSFLIGASLDGCSCCETSFASANLTSASCRSTNFRRATLQAAVLDDADIDGADFLDADVASLSLRQIRNAPGAWNLEKTSFPDEPSIFPRWFETARIGLFNKLCSWEALAKLGRLQLFGVSYALLIFLVTSFYIVGQYNDQVEIVKHWAKEQLNTDAQGDTPHPQNIASRSLAEQINTRLNRIYIGWQSFGLMASTLLLVGASMLFALRCPSEIKDFTSEQWRYAHNRPLIRYWPRSWSRPASRGAVGFLYSVGGFCFLTISTWKIINAFLYGWQNLRVP